MHIGPNRLDFGAFQSELLWLAGLAGQNERDGLRHNDLVDCAKAFVSQLLVERGHLLAEIEALGPEIGADQVVAAEALAALVDALKNLHDLVEWLIPDPYDGKGVGAKALAGCLKDRFGGWRKLIVDLQGAGEHVEKAYISHIVGCTPVDEDLAVELILGAVILLGGHQVQTNVAVLFAADGQGIARGIKRRQALLAVKNVGNPLVGIRFWNAQFPELTEDERLIGRRLPEEERADGKFLVHAVQQGPGLGDRPDELALEAGNLQLALADQRQQIAQGHGLDVDFGLLDTAEHMSALSGNGSSEIERTTHRWQLPIHHVGGRIEAQTWSQRNKLFFREVDSQRVHRASLRSTDTCKA